MRYALILLAAVVVGSAATAAHTSQASIDAAIDRLKQLVRPVHWQWRHMAADVPNAEQVDFDDSAWTSVDGAYLEFGSQPVFWLRTKITLPRDVSGVPVAGTRVTFRCGIDDEATLYVNGREVQQFKWDRGEAVLAESAKPGQSFTLALRCRNLMGPGRLLNANLDYERLASLSAAARAFVEDFEGARAALSTADREQRATYESVLSQAIDAVDFAALEAENDDRFLSSLKAASSMLDRVGQLARHLTAHLVGHAHIDMNWLWLWPETVDVCRNTFSTAAKLMDEFPGFIFSQSQPAVYLAMQREAPQVFATIKDRIKRGQWDAIGTTWTESDTNMASGESIVRSILYGKRYMRREFGVDSNVCWMPDTFGHVWTLPQILAKSGIKYYYFSRCNSSGAPVFWWQGPEGSKVLAYSYGGYSWDIEPRGLLRASVDFANRARAKNYMHVFGVGDHGGGPTREMLNVARELQARADYPKLEFSTVGGYFETLLRARPDLPTYNGELNTTFEGCYTTHADIKRWNRQSENLIPCAETFSAIAANWGTSYPRLGFEQSWRNTAFNQFHDLLCGSAIHDSYAYSRKLFEQAATQARTALNAGLDSLVKRITTKGPGTPVVVFNPLSWTRTDVVSVPTPFPGKATSLAVRDEAGRTWPARTMGDKLCFTARGVPALGYKVFWVRPASRPLRTGVKASGTTIENQFFRVTVDPRRGVITSIYDKANSREIVPKGEMSGLFQILLEEPHGMSAWTIGRITGGEDLTGESEVVITDLGPAKATVTFDQEYRDSQFNVALSLYDAVPRIDLAITADWQEKGSDDKPAPMAKIAFPVDVKDAKAAFEIPFGSIERPANGAEVPGQKWIDLSRPDYGVSLLNDCKYGFDVKGTTMRATLLRASYEPDPTPDQGLHEISLSLYPHRGDWKAAGTPRRAYELNQPLIARVAPAHAGSLPKSASFVSVTAPNVIVTALKRAEDDDSLILRFYEANGVAGKASIRLKLPAKSWVETDLLERPVGPKRPISNGEFTVSFGKHEIKTIKLLRQ